MINDDSIVDEIIKECVATGHDDRWCAHCESRKDGIETYRVQLGLKIGKKLKTP